MLPCDGEAPKCFKCIGDCKSKECTVAEKKCMNCVRYKRPKSNHSVIEQCFVVLKTEIQRVSNITNHDY